jgi:hypothetical protein
MHMLLTRFYNTFMGAQVTLEAHGHRVMALVPYFSVESLATLPQVQRHTAHNRLNHMNSSITERLYTNFQTCRKMKRI